MTEQLYALSGAQFADVSKVVRRVLKTSKLSPVEVATRPRRSSGIVRVQNVAEQYPVYDSLTTRQVALFELARDVETDVVQFFGEELHGLVQLQVGDISCEIDCRASTADLRAALGLSLLDCRVTAFPGLWEFAWEQATRKPITCIAKPAIESDFCFAGIVVYREGWRSVTSDGANPVLVDLLDAIPYLEGELKRGSVSIASALGDGLYVAHHWSCPAVSYRVK
jgi:hypothetical protein